MNSGLHSPQNNIDVEAALQHYNYIRGDIDRKVIIFPVMLKSSDGSVKYRYIHNKDDLLKVISKIEATGVSYNWYITPNSFYKRDRKQSSLQKLNYLFVDIDNHNFVDNESENDDSIGLLLMYLYDTYFQGKLPLPTMIVSTGRGLQLYWKIQSMSYNHKTIVFWNKIERGIIKILSDLDYNGFTVDKAVKDANRVLRLAGTCNLKSNSYAKVVHISDVVYNLTDISQRYIFDGLTTGEKYVRGKYKKKGTAKKKQTPFHPSGIEVGSLISAPLKRDTYVQHSSMGRTYKPKEIELLVKLRIRDLEKLMELRNGEFQNQRQTFMFLYGNCLRQLDMPTDTLEQMIVDINSKFSEPLPDGEAMHEAARTDVYFYKNYQIVDRLEITKDEQQHMVVLRIDLARMKKTEISAENKEKRLLEHQQTLQKVQQLTDEGYSLPQIAELLKVHPRTVSKYRKELGINLSKPSNKEAVMQLKSQGLTQAEVAEQLNISIRTVRQYWSDNQKEISNEEN